MSDGTRHGGADRLGEASDAASRGVRLAAAALEEQLSAGLAGVRTVAAGIANDGQVDADAFTDVLERLRSSAHDFIGVAADRARDLRAEDVHELTERFADDARNAFDALIDVVTLLPDVVRRVTDQSGTAKADG